MPKTYSILFAVIIINIIIVLFLIFKINPLIHLEILRLVNRKTG